LHGSDGRELAGGGSRTVRAAVSAGMEAQGRKSPRRDRSAGGSGEEKWGDRGRNWPGGGMWPGTKKAAREAIAAPGRPLWSENEAEGDEAGK
ncbi:MAG: hypothetical protein II837_07195, partial [Treponema sp.]|nr:hypothetical protein [Treponema sp.]